MEQKAWEWEAAAVALCGDQSAPFQTSRALSASEHGKMAMLGRMALAKPARRGRQELDSKILRRHILREDNTKVRLSPGESCEAQG